MTRTTKHLVRGRFNVSRQRVAVERLTRALSLFLLLSMLLSMLAPAVIQAQGLPTETPATAPETAGQSPEQAAPPKIDEQAPAASTVVPAAPATCAPSQQVYLPLVVSPAGPIPSGNSAPVAPFCAIALPTPQPFSLELNDIASDADGDALSYTLQSQPVSGTATLVGSTLTYTPTGFFTGREWLTYQVADGKGGTATGKIAVTIGADGNQPPIAGDVIFTLVETDTLKLNLAGIAGDPDGDPLSFALLSQPISGTATLIDGTLTYTPTIGKRGTERLLYGAADGQGGSDQGAITIHVVDKANMIPIAGDLTVPAVTTETVKIDLSQLVADGDNDPLTYTIALAPQYGTASVVTSTLLYTPTNLLANVDTITFRATDPDGAWDEGTITITPNPTKLHVTPGSVMFTGPGQDRTFTVRIFDGLGKELSTAGLDLEWVVATPGVATVTPSATGDEALVASAGGYGSTIVAVRSKAHPEIQSALFMVTVADPKDGAVLVPDAAVVFPDPNPLPNQSALPYPTDENGQPLIGGFGVDEIYALMEVVTSTEQVSGTLLGPDLKYPVVLKGQAPAVGSLLVPSENALAYGRVVQAVQRGEYALVQLELVDIPEAYDVFKVSVHSEDLVKAGLASYDQFSADQARPLFDMAPSSVRSLANDSVRTAAGGGGPCSGDWQGGLIQLVPVKPELNPQFDFDYDLENWSSPNFFRFVFGFKAALSAQVQFNLAASVTVNITCELGNGFAVSLLPAGPLQVLRLVVNPEFEIKPVLEIGFQITAGPRATMTAGGTLTAELQTGIVYANGATTKIYNFKKGADPIWSAPSATSINGIGFDLTTSVGLFLAGDGQFVLGGGILDFMETVCGVLMGLCNANGGIAEMRDKLTLEFMTLKMGPQLSVATPTVSRLLMDKQGGAASDLKLVASGEFKPEAFNQAFKRLGWQKMISIKLFEGSLTLADFHVPPTALATQVLPGSNVKKDQMVTIDVDVSRAVTKGGLYYDGELIAPLSTVSGGSSLQGIWTVSEAQCNAAKSQAIELDVIGYSMMPNDSIILPAVFEVPAYLGKIPVTCIDLTVEVTVDPDPAGMPGGVLYQCVEEGQQPEPLMVSFAYSAHDEKGKLGSIGITRYPETGDKVVVASKGGHDETDMEDMAAVFVPVGEQVALDKTYKLKFEVVALTQDLRKATKIITFTAIWRKCEARTTEREHRSRSEQCFTIKEERTREIWVTIDPVSGKPTVNQGEWSDWGEIGRTATGICTRVTGDPHILTPDGTEFDSFALGEFTYLRPRPGRDGITVQTRQERIGVIGRVRFFDWTSWNTAIAVKADGKVFQFEVGQLNSPLVDGVRQTYVPGLHSFGEVDLKINSAREVELRYKNNHLIVNESIGFLDLRATVPQDGSLYGMLGTPNGDSADDFRWPDGTPARDAFDLADGWRVTSKAESLFTYEQGEGPETYNLPQTGQPPTREELAPYVDQARALLEQVCAAETIDEGAVNDAALELYTGREPSELAGSGLCWYVVQGTVTNALVPDLPVPGATVTISSLQLETCVTSTDRYGYYRCWMPALGELPTLMVAVSGRGTGSAATFFGELPLMGGALVEEQNLAVAPTTIELNGLVQDGQGRPLYNAEARITGPEGAGFGRAYAQADGDGRFKTYLMVNDGVSGGNTRYQVSYNPEWSTRPDVQGVQATFNRALPALREHELNVVTETLTLSGTLVRFSGRVAYQFDQDKAMGGVRVLVTPTSPIGSWTGCDVRSLRLVTAVVNPAEETSDETLVGTYSCDVVLANDAPFEVRIGLAGQEGALVQVDPLGKSVGESLPVIYDMQVADTVLRLSGVARSTTGQPLVGVQITAGGDQNQLLNPVMETITGADGSYELLFGVFNGVTSGKLSYRASYGSSVDHGEVAFANLAAGQLNQLTANPELGGRTLHFSGRVFSGYLPQSYLGGTVAISSPTLGLVCAARIGSTGGYACDKVVELSDEQALDFSYAIGGDWGSTTSSYRLDDLPGLGEERTVTLDVAVYPTTLRLTGAVRKPSGAALSGARVVAQVGGVSAEGRTSPDGRYSLALVLPQGVSTGVISYTVSQLDLPERQAHSFSVPAGELSSISRDFSYGYRRAYFSGKLRNDYGVELPFSSVAISSPALAEVCRTQTSADGSFFCASQTDATEPFSITVTAAGVWGDNSFEQTVPAQADQDVLSHHSELLISPTVLHVAGKVTAPDGTSLAGVEVTVGGDYVYRLARGTTDAAGNYNFYVVLRPGATTTFGGMLSYRVGYGTATTTRNVGFTARENEATELMKDFTLNTRVVHFSGSVKNALLKEAAVTGTRVVISAVELGKLCEYSSLTRFSSSGYSCDATVVDGQPLQLEYFLDGPWGTATITGSLETLPEVGQRLDVRRDLEVVLTTLALRGVVVDRDGAPIGGAKVTVSGGELLKGGSDATGVEGAYEIFVTLRAGATDPTISYTVEANGDEPLQAQRAVHAEPLAVTEHVEDFTFASRVLKLSGTLHNLTDPSLPLGAQLLIVSPSLGGELCRTTISATYSCQTLVRTDDPITLNYRAEGIWGSSVLINQIVPGGALSYTKDLEAAPRVLRLGGKVTTSGGAPLAGARVEVTSYTIQPGVKTSLGTSTDADGNYALTAVLAEGIAQGQLSYTVEREGNSVAMQRSFAFEGSEKLAALEQNFQLTVRSIRFSGELINTHTGDSAGWSQTRLVISSPTLGRLCDLLIAGRYDCRASLRTDQPFDVTYRLTGSWGSAELTRTITAVPGEGQTGLVEQVLAATPTMVRVRGYAYDAAGAPIANVSVRANSFVSSQWGSAISDGTGAFELLVVLNQIGGPVSGSLALTAVYGPTRLEREVAYSVSPGQLVTVDAEALPFEFQERHIRINGQLVNTLVPGLEAAQPTANILITSIQGEPLCPQVRASEFSCGAAVYSDQPFEAVIHVYSDWGSAEKRVLLDNIPGPGGAAEYRADVELAPTTLYLHGAITDPSGKPMAGADVRVRFSKDEFQNVRTDASGHYELYQLFKGTSTALSYVITYDGIETAYDISSVLLKAGQLTTRQQSFTIEKRRIRFTGSVTNELVDGLGVPARVVVTSADLFSTRYCDAATRPDGSFTCDAYVRSSEPITVNYRLSGGWGQRDITQAVTGIPDVGGTLVVEQHVEVAPTTLQLGGQVADPFGKPLGETEINISSADGLGTVKATTGADGRYAAYLMLRDGVTAGDVSYRLSYYKARLGESRGFQALQQHKLNPFTQNFEIASRVVGFTGVARQLANPSQAVNGALRIEAPGIGVICNASVGSNGQYSCRADAITTEAFSVSYTLSGDWGSHRVTDTVDFGAAGSELTYTRNVEPALTTLRLTGTIAAPDGARLGGVAVEVLGPELSTLSDDVSTTTDGQGVYTLDVVLKSGIASGALTYRLSYGQTRGATVVPFTATAGTRTEVAKDLTFSSRVLVFKGAVQNTLAGLSPVQGTTIKIVSPVLGNLCEAISQADGSYQCQVEVVNGERFAVEYQLGGGWGSARSAGVVAAGGVGSTLEVPRNLGVAPTTLRLTGTVTDASGLPLSGAAVLVTGPDLLSSASASTTVSGTYAVDVLVRGGVSFQTLSYHVGYNSVSLSQSRQQRFTRNALNGISQSFTFGQRRFDFSGQVRNALAPGMELHGGTTNEVAISSPQLGDLCQAAISNGGYSCFAQLKVTEPFSVEYRLSGDWGSAVFTRTVSTLPAIGASASVTRELSLSLTTLRLHGTATLAGGGPLQGATLSVSGAQLATLNGQLWTTTGADGSYELFVVVDQGVATGALSYGLSHQGIAKQGSIAFTAQPAQLSQVPTNLSFDQRQVSFSGLLRHAQVADLPVPVKDLKIAVPGAGQLCHLTNLSAGYSCAGQLSSTEALSVTYTASGDWGTQVLTGTIPAGAAGSKALLTRHLQLSPNVLKLTGTVTNGAGTALAGASITVQSSAFLAQVSGQTSVTGTYTLYPILGAGQSGGTLSYQVNANGVTSSESGSFSASGVVTPVARNIAIGERQIVFSGSIQNALAGNETTYGATALTISAPGLGTLCERYPASWESNGFASYSCSKQIGGADAFTVTYVLSGTWGTYSYQALVPAGAPGSSTNVAKPLPITPTTLEISGQVKRPDQSVVSFASVGLVGAGLAYEPSWVSTSQSEGRYTIRAVLKAGVTSGDLSVKVMYNGSVGLEPLSFSVPASQLTRLTRHVTFSARSFNLAGNIENGHVDWALPLAADHVVVTSPGLGTLCSWANPYPGSTAYGTSYSCAGSVATTSALSLTYTVSGTWGVASIPGQLPAGAAGSYTGINLTLDALPTTLHITGTLQDWDGTPLPGGYVGVSGPAVVGSNAQYSEGDGGYEFYVVLKQGVVSGTVDLTGSYNYGATKARQLTFATQPGQLHELPASLTLSDRTLYFQGNLLNEFNPASGVQATSVRITSQHGLLCEVNNPWGSSGYYCSAVVTTTNPLSVTYSVSGAWGTKAVTGSVTSFPAVGSSGSVARNITIAPTTLKLTGVVSDDQGQPIKDANVIVTGPGIVGAPSAYTTISGTYTLYAVVAESAVASGTLQYEVEYRQDDVTRTRGYSGLQAGQLNALEQDLTFDERRVYFNGYITHAQLTGQTVASTSVVVKGPSGTLCSWSYAQGGTNYGCTATITTSQALSVTYEISGLWGQATIPGSVAAAQIGSSETLSRNLPVAPATLELTGTVSDWDGTRLQNLYVEVAGSGVQSAPLYSYIGETGVYTIYAILKQDALSGTVNYRVLYNLSQFSSDSASYTAQAGAITSLARPLTFARRTLNFGGSIVNALVSGQGVPARRVEVSSPTLGTLCVSEQPWQPSSFSCSAVVNTTQAFSVTYTVIGDWGTQVATGYSVTEFPPVGESRGVSHVVPVTTTTLLLTGTLSGPDGQPLEGATISVWGDGLAGGGATTTDISGTYRLAVAPKSNVVTPTLTYQVGYGSAQQLFEGSFGELAAGQVTELERDLTFSARRIELYGSIVNGLVAGEEVLVPSTRVEVIAEGLGTLCVSDTPWESAYYDCSATITSSGPLTVSYVVSGAWGSQTVSGGVISGLPEVGGYAAVSRDLAVAPTTLKLLGQVVGPDGAGLDYPDVYVESDAFVDGEIYADVDGSGHYVGYAVVRSDAVTGTLKYTTYYGWATHESTATFGGLAAGQLNTVSRPINFNLRTVELWGNHKDANGSFISSTSTTVSVPDKGVVCNTYGTSYYCEFDAPVEALTATVTVTLPGGKTSSAEVAIAADEVGEYLSVRRDIVVTP